MMDWFAKIAGPKVLLGVVLAAALVIGFLWLRLNAAQASATQATQAEAQLRDSLKASEAEAAEQRQAAERLQKTLVERDEAIRHAQQQATDFSNALDKLRKSNPEVRNWADGVVPADVLDRLRNPIAGGANTSGTGEAPSGAASALPHTGDGGKH